MPLYKNGILFELGKMAFAVEIALAVARKDTSTIQIKNKQDLYQVLTNREMFDMVLEQGLDYVLSDKETSMIRLGSNNCRKITGVK
jgi:KaiC/GvpD/RAD55 family RecA-like ATPase